MTTIYLETNWYFICILQFAGLAKVSNMEAILYDQKMADLHSMHVVKYTTYFHCGPCPNKMTNM